MMAPDPSVLRTFFFVWAAATYSKPKRAGCKGGIRFYPGSVMYILRGNVWYQQWYFLLSAMQIVNAYMTVFAESIGEDLALRHILFCAEVRSGKVVRRRFRAK